MGVCHSACIGVRELVHLDSLLWDETRVVGLWQNLYLLSRLADPEVRL